MFLPPSAGTEGIDHHCLASFHFLKLFHGSTDDHALAPSAFVDLVIQELFSDLIPKGERRAEQAWKTIGYSSRAKMCLKTHIYTTVCLVYTSGCPQEVAPSTSPWGTRTSITCQALPGNGSLCALCPTTLSFFPKGIPALRKGSLSSPRPLTHSCPLLTLARTPTQKQQLHGPCVLLSVFFQLLFQLSGVLLLSAGPSPHGPSSRQRDRVGSLWPPQTTFWPQSQQSTGASTDLHRPWWDCSVGFES